jgi:hypothetical protein
MGFLDAASTHNIAWASFGEVKKMDMKSSCKETQGVYRERLLRCQIEDEFRSLSKQVGRQGIIGFSSLEDTKLMPVQSEYLARKLNGLGPRSKIAAISIGLLYREQEILAG